MDPYNHSFPRSTSLPADSHLTVPYHRGYPLKQDYPMSHKATPITPPLSPGHSESSDDDDYLLDDDMNGDDEDCSDSHEGAQLTQPLTPAQSDFSGMHVDTLPSEERPQPPLRLLENERVHLLPTGPGGIRLVDFEVRGTLGMSKVFTADGFCS